MNGAPGLRIAENENFRRPLFKAGIRRCESVIDASKNTHAESCKIVYWLAPLAKSASAIGALGVRLIVIGARSRSSHYPA